MATAPKSPAVAAIRADVDRSIAEAVLETLGVRERLVWYKLQSFALHRWRRAHRGVEEPSEAAVETVITQLAHAGSIVEVGLRADGVSGARGYELAKGHPVAKKLAKVRSAKKKAAQPLSRGRCYFLSSLTDGLFETVAAALRARFEVFHDTASAVAFRWKHPFGCGPDFRLERSDFPTLKRQTRYIQYRNLRNDPRDFKSVVVLIFDDVDAVLDETNGLIEAQQVIQSIAKGPSFNAWNKGLNE